jgi:hypothetical protein
MSREECVYGMDVLMILMLFIGIGIGWPGNSSDDSWHGCAQMGGEGPELMCGHRLADLSQYE